MKQIDEIKQALESVGICIDLETVHDAVDEALATLTTLTETHDIVPKGEMPKCRGVEYGSYENTILLPRPEHMYPTEKGCWIQFDKCLLDEILTLWRKGVWTLNSCCGHCQQRGFIAVDEESVEKMLDLGYEPDHRGNCKTSFYCKTDCQAALVAQEVGDE